MKNLYKNLDLYNAMRQKKRLFLCYVAVAVFYALFLSACIAFYCLLPYNDGRGVIIIVAASIVTGIFIVFSFPYLGISYKRSKAYCKMLKYLSCGLKEYAVLPFEGIEDWTTKDGVDVNVATFSIKNPKRDEKMIRRIFIDGEKDFPPFEEGKKYGMILQGNLLIAYETES